MRAVLKTVPARLMAWAPRVTHIIESLVLASFFTTLAVSAAGQLHSPLFYLGALTLAGWSFLRLTQEPALMPAAAMEDDSVHPKLQTIIIASFAVTLLALSLFMSPASADGQRIKLIRILLGVQHGSAWSTSGVDELSTMYYFPAPFSFIFMPIEALHLPQVTYAVVNALLILGSLLSLLLLMGNRRSLDALFVLVLFIAAPQFVFAGLEEHEDALSFFLATRAALWFTLAPIRARNVFLFAFITCLSIVAKPPTAIFLPFALVVLAFYYAGWPRLREWLRPKSIMLALVLGIPALLLALLPDLLVDADRGITIFDQFKRLGAYHVASLDGCRIPHFFLRLFEFFFDLARTGVHFVGVNATFLLPEFDFLPKRCAFEDTSLKSYFIPNQFVRESMQFGFLPVVALTGLFLAKDRDRYIVRLSWALFFVAVAIYASRLTYWTGTGRYFMVGFLILVPAFIISLRELRRVLEVRYYHLLLVAMLAPAVFIVFSSLDNIPRQIFQGNRIASRAAGITPALKTIDGKVNIYFNDLMSFYTLLRLMPSNEVTLLRKIVPDATNIIAIPREYSPDMNWHDPFWFLPVPSARGEFTFMGPVKKTFGNRVPMAFFMGNPDVVSADPGRVEMKVYFPDKAPDAWAKSLGRGYHAQTFALKDETRYFIYTDGVAAKDGLCLRKKADRMSWQILTLESCKAL